MNYYDRKDRIRYVTDQLAILSIDFRNPTGPIKSSYLTAEASGTEVAFEVMQRTEQRDNGASYKGYVTRLSIPEAITLRGWLNLVIEEAGR